MNVLKLAILVLLGLPGLGADKKEAMLIASLISVRLVPSVRKKGRLIVDLKDN